MMEFIKKIFQLPLIIKLPIFLALSVLFIFLVLLGVSQLSHVVQDSSSFPACYLSQSGQLSQKNERFSFISHFYLDSKGQFRISGLKDNKIEWLSAEVYKDQHFNFQLKSIKRTENFLQHLGELNFEILDTNNSLSIIKVKETGRVFLSEDRQNLGVKHFSNLGLCGENWLGPVNFKIANSSHLVAWDQQGRIGFYPISAMKDNIPREVPQSPEFIFLAQSPNHLIRISCSEMKLFPSTFIHFNQGLLSYSASPFDQIAQYQVNSRLLEFERQNNPRARKGSKEFFITTEDEIFEQFGSFWSMSEQWKSLHYALPGRPLRSQSYADEESIDNWILTIQKQLFDDQIYLSRINSKLFNYETVKLSQIIDSSVTYFHWVILPGLEHLILPSQIVSSIDYRYQQIKCPKISINTSTQ